MKVGQEINPFVDEKQCIMGVWNYSILQLDVWSGTRNTRVRYANNTILIQPE